MKSVILRIHRNLHFCLNLTEIRKESDEFSTIAQLPDRQSNHRQNEDSIEPGTETITISNAPLPNGRVKAQTTVDTDDTVYSGWYKTVYYPETVTEAAQAVNAD